MARLCRQKDHRPFPDLLLGNKTRQHLLRARARGFPLRRLLFVDLGVAVCVALCGLLQGHRLPLLLVVRLEETRSVFGSSGATRLAGQIRNTAKTG